MMLVVLLLLSLFFLFLFLFLFLLTMNHNWPVFSLTNIQSLARGLTNLAHDVTLLKKREKKNNGNKQRKEGRTQTSKHTDTQPRRVCILCG